MLRANPSTLNIIDKAKTKNKKFPISVFARVIKVITTVEKKYIY